MLLGDKIVFKKLKKYEDVKEYIDEFEYKLLYLEYLKLKHNEFYEYSFNEDYKTYVPVEIILKSIKDEEYVFKVCDDMEEFIDEVCCLTFEEYLLEDL